MNKMIAVDTLDKYLALIAAIDDRIAKLMPLVEGSTNPHFKRIFGQDIVDLKAIVADLRNP